MTWIVIGATVVVVLVVAWIVQARRRAVTDGVDSFRRQIDALSPEARRPVVDQVQKQAEADDDTRSNGAGTSDAGTDDAGTDDEGDADGA